MTSLFVRVGLTSALAPAGALKSVDVPQQPAMSAVQTKKQKQKKNVAWQMMCCMEESPVSSSLCRFISFTYANSLSISFVAISMMLHPGVQRAATLSSAKSLVIYVIIQILDIVS